MRSIFTIHAGELIVGEHLERKFKGINVWVPTKDSGIDLLVTNRSNKKTISFQVKFSRDFLPLMDARFEQPLRACGWFQLNRQKIEKSASNFWVFAIVGSKNRSRDFVVIKPGILKRKLDHIHGEKQQTMQVYFWVTENDHCWETRGLTKKQQIEICQGAFRNAHRDFTAYLNNWEIACRL